MPALTDAEARKHAEEVLRKLPPSGSAAPSPAPSAGAAG
jgi:hypothetical protein